MLVLILHSMHLPAGTVFGVVFAGYPFIVLWVILNGYVREVTGWHHPGRPSRMHRLLFQIHTGLHIGTHRTYGDEKRLNRAAANTSRATPEGLAVYFSPLRRWQRALRNNIIIVVLLGIVCGMTTYPRLTVQLTTFLLVFGMNDLAYFLVARKRKRHHASLPVSMPTRSFWATRKAKDILGRDTVTVGATPKMTASGEPRLVSGVPPPVIARLIANEMGCSATEAMGLLKLAPDRGRMSLPDSYAALSRSRETVQEIISSHTEGKVRFAWATTASPRMLSWFPVATSLPSQVLFRDYLSGIESARPGTQAVGVKEDKGIFYADYNGDTPWHIRAAGSGTGKSTGFLVKAAQICHQDPEAEIYCVDTKQVSFEHLHNIPGVKVFDNPQSEMSRIWQVFYDLVIIMRERYTAVREKRARIEDFNDIWVLVDEGNDLAGHLKSYYTRRVKQPGDPSQPVIWPEAIAPLLRLGRQARIRGEFMLQDVTDRALGGESLKMAFGAFGMAVDKRQQWERIIGPPCPPLQTGPGRICMVHGPVQQWVQSFYDDPGYLREYALANRKASSNGS